MVILLIAHLPLSGDLLRNMNTPAQPWSWEPVNIPIRKGHLLRRIDNPKRVLLISHFQSNGVHIGRCGRAEEERLNTYHELASSYEYSIDEGQSWFSCTSESIPSSMPPTFWNEEEANAECPYKEARIMKEKPLSLTLVTLSWLLMPLFAIVTILLAVPGAIICWLEPRFRKVMQ